MTKPPTDHELAVQDFIDRMMDEIYTNPNGPLRNLKLTSLPALAASMVQLKIEPNADAIRAAITDWAPKNPGILKPDSAQGQKIGGVADPKITPEMKLARANEMIAEKQKRKEAQARKDAPKIDRKLLEGKSPMEKLEIINAFNWQQEQARAKKTGT